MTNTEASSNSSGGGGPVAKPKNPFSEGSEGGSKNEDATPEENLAILIQEAQVVLHSDSGTPEEKYRALQQIVVVILVEYIKTLSR